jgi:hypothetical protein
MLCHHFHPSFFREMEMTTDDSAGCMLFLTLYLCHGMEVGVVVPSGHLPIHVLAPFERQNSEFFFHDTV